MRSNAPTSGPPNERTVTISVRLPRSIRDAVEVLAARSARSRSATLRLLIEHALALEAEPP